MTATLRERISEHEWYHTLELAPGVLTPGFFDTRLALEHVPLPDSLAGRRCLDVGTFDGFWAFEMERRGADEVMAVDVLDPAAWDWPAGSTDATTEAIGRRKGGGRGFELAHEALGSRVERRELSIYDLDPAVVGSFDFVYVGSLLLHLRDPVLALAAVRRVCRGELVLVDAVDLRLSLLLPGRPAARLDAVGRPWWWKPNTAGLVRMVEAAGFEVGWGPARFYMQFGPGWPRPRLGRRLFSSWGPHLAVAALKGEPHAALLARPGPP